MMNLQSIYVRSKDNPREMDIVTPSHTRGAFITKLPPPPRGGIHVIIF